MKETGKRKPPSGKTTLMDKRVKKQANKKGKGAMVYPSGCHK